MAKWSKERRAAAAERIRLHKPWLKTRGPKTPEGKARSSRNAYKGGRRPAEREFLALIRSALAVTAEATATLKNPPVIAQQANISHRGYQQLNNGARRQTSPADASGVSPPPETIGRLPRVRESRARPAASGSMESPDVGSAGR